MIEPMLSGLPGHDINTDDYEHMRDLELIAHGDEIWVANPIYTEIVPPELTFIVQMRLRQQAAWHADSEGSLESAELRAAFQQFFHENSEHWLERFGYKEGVQPLLQAFLQRVFNGVGRN